MSGAARLRRRISAPVRHRRRRFVTLPGRKNLPGATRPEGVTEEHLLGQKTGGFRWVAPGITRGVMQSGYPCRRLRSVRQGRRSSMRWRWGQGVIPAVIRVLESNHNPARRNWAGRSALWIESVFVARPMLQSPGALAACTFRRRPGRFGRGSRCWGAGDIVVRGVGRGSASSDNCPFVERARSGVKAEAASSGAARSDAALTPVSTSGMVCCPTMPSGVCIVALPRSRATRTIPPPGAPSRWHGSFACATAFGDAPLAGTVVRWLWAASELAARDGPHRPRHPSNPFQPARSPSGRSAGAVRRSGSADRAARRSGPANHEDGADTAAESGSGKERFGMEQVRATGPES